MTDRQTDGAIINKRKFYEAISLFKDYCLIFPN